MADSHHERDYCTIVQENMVKKWKNNDEFYEYLVIGITK